MGTSETPRIFSWSSDNTLKRWKLTHQTSRDGGNKSGRLLERLCRRRVHQRRATRSHSGVSQRRHFEQRNITRYYAGGGSVQAKPSQAEHSAKRVQKRLTSLVSFGKILGRARHLRGRRAFNGSQKAEIECTLQAMVANCLGLRGF